jgi:hypothetical protein
VRVPFAKDEVTAAPKMEADGELSEDDEAALYTHYGMDYAESRSDRGLPAGGKDSGRDVSSPETVRKEQVETLGADGKSR